MMTTAPDKVRPEDVTVIVAADLLTELQVGSDTVLSYEDEGWALCLWCLFNGAVYYAAPAARVDLADACMLAASKGCTKVVVDNMS